MTTTAKQAQLIDRAFDSIPELELSGRDRRLELYKACRESESQHRVPAPFYPRARLWGLSLTHAAKYFAVKWLKDAALATTSPPLHDYFRLRPECFLAYALASDPGLRPKLDRWLLTADWVDAFDALDYTELVKAPA